MTKEQFKEWKVNNPFEYNSVLIEVMEKIFSCLLTNSLDTAFWMCPTKDIEE